MIVFYRKMLGHLWMAHGFVDDDSLEEHRVLHASANLANDLDQLKVHVLLLQIYVKKKWS